MTPTVTPPPVADPFYIGWRDACRTLADGSIVWEQIPLTLEDALHPQKDDKIVTNTNHDRDCRYLHDLLEQRFANDAHAVILGDCKVLWPDGSHHSPDVAAIFGVREVLPRYSQFDVAEEGVRPRLIVEFVSPNTRVNDVDKKFAAYHRYGVEWYVVVDRPDEDAEPVLLGFERLPRRYRRMPLEDDGRLWLPPVGIYLGVRDDRIVAYDGDTDEELGDYTAVVAALTEEQARADDEKARADEEKRRADTADRRAGTADRRADAEKRRADAADRRADAEKRRADAAESRLKALEEQIVKLSGPPTA